MSSSHLISVVIAARDAAHYLPRCLSALIEQSDDLTEIVVVDDFSSDDTFEVAKSFPVQVIRLPTHEGVAAARNRGVDATTAPIILFLDADVVPAPDTLRLARAVMADPEIEAAFGSYDDQPDGPSTVSLFKNLSHHFVHHHSPGRAVTFWTGCGLVRREAFLAVNGFDDHRFSVPAGEDIEFGMRLTDHGFSIRLVPELQVKHLKHWTLRSMVSTDVFRRAVPWTVFCLERGGFPYVLNLSLQHRVASFIALLLLVVLGIAISLGEGLRLMPLLGIAAVGVNWPLYRFFYRGHGARFAVLGFLLQQLYYLCAMSGLMIGTATYFRTYGWRAKTRALYFGKPRGAMERVDAG